MESTGKNDELTVVCDQVFSPHPSSKATAAPAGSVPPATPLQGVTNEDLMLKLCANGKEISKLSQSVEELRSAVFCLQTENDSLRKVVKELHKREDELKSKLSEIKFIAEMANRKSEELALYIRRNNIRIFGVGETTGEKPEECEEKVLSIFSNRLKVKSC